MPTIISVRPAGSASLVEFDDGGSLRCTREFARRSGFRRGQEIDAVFVARLRDSAWFDFAICEARRLSRLRRYSRMEIANKLAAARVPPDAARSVLDELEERGEIDERSVALALARKGVRQALRRDPQLERHRFRIVQTRRLLLRGFGAATASAACREAWSEIVGSAFDATGADAGSGVT